MIGYRVQETTLTTGTGTLELGGAVGTGFRSFRDEFADGAQVFYVIASVNSDGNGAYEVGIGTLTHGTPDTLTRDTVIRSSNGGAKVSWGPGPKFVLNDFPADVSLLRQALGLGNIATLNVGTGLVSSGGALSVIAPLFQCRLTKSGANLKLSRHNGLHLFCNGKNRTIPAAGLTLAPTGAVADTTYYIYAADADDDGELDTLERSTAAPADDSTYGHKIKTGDATRSLVGMARTITGPAWADSETQRFVRGWFNDDGVQLFSGVAEDAVPSLTFEAHSGNKIEGLFWDNDNILIAVSGHSQNATVGSNNQSTIGIDGSNTGSPVNIAVQSSTTVPAPQSVQRAVRVSTGYHYFETFIAASAGTAFRTAISAVASR